MLISFKVSNYKSLRDPQELSMLPSRRDSEFEALPVAAIYGANASGKSNLIEALCFKDNLAGAWTEPLHRPFRLDRRSRKHSTSYEIECELDGVRYEYRLSVSSVGIVNERLSSYPAHRKRILLDRTGDRITIGATMTNRSALQELSSETPSNTPTLSMAEMFRATEWQPFWQWLQRGLRSINLDHSYLSSFTTELPDAIERHPVLIELAKVADLGIADIRVVDLAALKDETLLEALTEFLETRRDQRHQALTKSLLSEVASEEEDLDQNRIRQQILSFRHLEFYHQSHGQPLAAGDQSRGTISFLLYMARILDALQDGASLVIDEFDTSLHPRIIPRIIELFQDKRTNPKNAQLIFSTHDATLLGTSFGEPILKRDEVWFVEKQEDGASELYPLTSFKPRKEHNLERHYLGGSYGGVPDIHPESLVEIVAAANKTE
ncbi:AAA family ATPase [Glycomyces niveus]|uniref:AAA family ATPase n=1 Tax=Glycomyces niveus TaxID=2820287 RepID=A0ABS3U628_9ACTN|nr:ATP-binding protein [Glycomyces sp. NEAU-S30]MBO3734229.1 AAA family ATPase [Glycomyces sp. NEAU-S30]